MYSKEEYLEGLKSLLAERPKIPHPLYLNMYALIGYQDYVFWLYRTTDRHYVILSKNLKTYEDLSSKHSLTYIITNDLDVTNDVIVNIAIRRDRDTFINCIKVLYKTMRYITDFEKNSLPEWFLEEMMIRELEE